MTTPLEAARKRLREAQFYANEANEKLAVARADVMRLSLDDSVWKWLHSLQVGDQVCLSVETQNWWTVADVTDLPSLELSRPDTGKSLGIFEPLKIQRAYYATQSLRYSKALR